MFIKNSIFLPIIVLSGLFLIPLHAFTSLPLINSPLNNSRTVYHKQYILMGDLRTKLRLPFPIQAYFNGQSNDPYDDVRLYAQTPSQAGYEYDPSFTITVSIPYTEVYILITQRFNGQSRSNQKNAHNIIEHLKLENEEPYICFRCRRTFYLSTQDAKQELSSWQIEQVQLDCKSDNCIKIPENTIIIIADPNWIESLVASEWDARSAVIKLPTIVFKSSITQQELDDLAVMINLSIMDHRPFHKPTRKATKQAHPGLVISMSTPNHETIHNPWHRNIL
jgi:hypothetical protein